MNKYDMYTMILYLSNLNFLKNDLHYDLKAQTEYEP